MTTRTHYTLADVASVIDWFSDAYKDVNGFRPRGFTDQQMINWLNTTDVQGELDQQAADEQTMLTARGFKNMTEFYDHLENELYANRNGLHKPLTPAEAQLKIDTDLTDLEMMDPRLNHRAV